jgi:hypothetical protein
MIARTAELDPAVPLAATVAAMSATPAEPLSQRLTAIREQLKLLADYL